MVTKDIKHKLQGNGKDSWEIKEKDKNGNVLSVYMVYENPNTDKDANLLIESFKKLTPEQKLAIKTILK